MQLIDPIVNETFHMLIFHTTSLKFQECLPLTAHLGWDLHMLRARYPCVAITVGSGPWTDSPGLH